MTERSSIGTALAAAIARVRELAKDPMAAVLVLTPSTVNGALARRELAAAGSFVRVDFVTPVDLMSRLAESGLRDGRLTREPAGWLRATLRRRVEQGGLPGGFDEVLAEPGWMAAIVSAITMLESGGVAADALRKVAGAGSLAPDLAGRTAMLAALLDGVRTARSAENIAGPDAEAAAARDVIGKRLTVPANVPAGAVLLGDARGTRLVSEVVASWLAERHVVRVAPAAIAVLSPAEHGLTRSAPHAEVVAVPPHAPTVTFIRTPDPTREMSEAVREAQAAIARGVALDRIAIVLPDPGEATALADALSYAEIPATWLTGPPLAQSAAARFLVHAIELSLGNESVVHWYDLLRRSELRVRAVLGEPAARGRGRWRNLIARTEVGHGTKRLVTELARLRAEDGPSGETADARDARIGAIDALTLVLERLNDALAALRTEQSVGAHARALREFVRTWWAPTRDQAVVVRLLESWGRSLRGPSIGLGELAAALRETFESTETLSGGLKDPAIRVLSPMQLIGAELDVVMVTGITEGRFPRRPSEDPLVVDAIIDAVASEVPTAGLFRSGDRVDLERRRLAAIRSAAATALWLSSPRLEMLEGRPLQPGSVLLDLASELAGSRVLPSELARKMVPVGRRSRPWPDDGERTLGPSEHLLTRLHSPDEAVRRAALEALIDHTTARRIVTAERARGRLARGELDSALRSHAGFVEPSVLRCVGLDGSPLRPRDLAELLASPEAFFLRHALGAWPAKRLRDGWDPVAAWYVEQTVLHASRTALERGGPDLATRFRAAFDEKVGQALDRAGNTDVVARTRLGQMGQRAIDDLLRTGPTTGAIVSLETAPIADDLPWRMREGDARRLGTGLEWVVAKVPGPKSIPNAIAELIEAAARRTLARVDAIDFVDLRGQRRSSDDPVEHIDGVVETVRLALPAIDGGYFPVKADPEGFAQWRAEAGRGATS